MVSAERSAILWSALLLTCWTVGEAMVPAVVGATVDAAVATADLTALVIWLVVLAACFAFLSFGFRWGSRVGVFATNRQKHKLRGMVTAVALDPAHRPEKRRLPGEVAALAAADSDAASLVLRQLAMGGAAVLGLVASAVYLLWADLWVGVTVLVISPLALFTLRWLTPRLSSTSHRHQEGIAAAGASAADVMRGVEVLRGIGGEATAGGWYAGHSRAAARAGVDSANASGRMAAAHVLVSGAVLVIAAVVGAFRVDSSAMSVGTLVGVLGVTAFLASPLGMIIGLAEEYTRSAASATRIAGYLADGTGGQGQDGGRRPVRPVDPGSSVTVRLGDGTTVDCAPGQFTAVVCGDSGLRQRLTEVLSSVGVTGAPGGVVVGGRDLVTVDPVELPGTVRVSPHEAHLFAGTVRRNITGAGVPAGGSGTVSGAVLRASGVDELAELFPDGLDHRVDGEGRNLSGGQRQRIALARALHGPPVVRVLVDPTTAVDSVTESRIAARLRELRGGGGRSDHGTLVVVTTSPSLLAVADAVVFLRGPGVTTTAPHQVLGDDPVYAEVVTR